jgi:hypothetical protein
VTGNLGGDALDLSIDRLVLDGLDLPSDAAETLRARVESELGRILHGRGTTTSARPELEPIVLGSPPDMLALARVLAARIADEADRAGAWDG